MFDFSNISSNKLEKFIFLISPLMYLSLFVFILLQVFERSILSLELHAPFDKVYNLIRVIWILIYLFKIILFRVEKRELICFFLFISFSYISKRINQSYFLYDCFFVPMFLASFVDIKKIIYLFFSIFIIGTLSIIILDFLGFFPKLVSFRGSDIRYNLGFCHPNSLGLMIMVIAMTYVIAIKKLKIFSTIFLLLLSLFCYKIPNSFSSTFSILLLTVCTFLSTNRQVISFFEKIKKVHFVVIFLFILFLLIIYLVGYYANNINFKLLFTGEIGARFILGYKGFIDVGLSLFGKTVNVDYPIDSVYYFLPIYWGILPTIMYFGLYLFFVINAFSKKDYKLFLIQCIVLLYGISEAIIVSPIFMFIYFVDGLTNKQLLLRKKLN